QGDPALQPELPQEAAVDLDVEPPVGCVDERGDILDDPVGEGGEADGGNSVPEVDDAPLQAVVPRLLPYEEGVSRKIFGQAANLHRGLLVEAVDVREDLENKEETSPPGSQIEAPGPDVTTIGDGKSR